MSGLIDVRFKGYYKVSAKLAILSFISKLNASFFLKMFMCQLTCMPCVPPEISRGAVRIRLRKFLWRQYAPDAVGHHHLGE